MLSTIKHFVEMVHLAEAFVILVLVEEVRHGYAFARTRSMPAARLPQIVLSFFILCLV